MSAPGLFDAWDGSARRDAGGKLAENSVHTSWRLAAEEAIRRLAATGREFTSDDLHEAIGDPPGHANSVGSLFLSAARRGEIVAVGYRKSARTEANARVVRTWRGAGRAPRRDTPRDRPGSGSVPRAEPRRDPPAPSPREQTRKRSSAAGWAAADVQQPCVACGRPAFLRDPQGRPRHRVDCTGGDRVA